MSEHLEQSALFQWANMASGQLPELALLFAIPNGGHRRKAVAAKLKAEGVKAGVPDVCLPVARGPYHGLYIELKAGKNKATPAQMEWLQSLTRQRYFTTVCVGWESARDVLAWYLGGAFGPVLADADWRTQVRNALAIGASKIDAIKLCRNISGMGLRESKEAVEAMIALDELTA